MIGGRANSTSKPTLESLIRTGLIFSPFKLEISIHQSSNENSEILTR